MDFPATTLHVRTDDLLKASPHLAPWRPAVWITQQLSDAELVTLAMRQTVLGFRPDGSAMSAPTCNIFPYVPERPSCNKLLRNAADLLRQMTRTLAVDTSVAVTCGSWPPLPSNADDHGRPSNVRPGQMGRVRLLRQPQALLLGGFGRT